MPQPIKVLGFIILDGAFVWLYRDQTGDQHLGYRSGAYMSHIYFMRTHRVGDPSAPTNLRGKQWSEYTPAGTSSSFKASTTILSYVIHMLSSLVNGLA